jgi:hypothetical protein
VRTYLLYMLDRQGKCVGARVINAETDAQAVDLAEMVRGECDAHLFERRRKVAALEASAAST